MKTLSATLLLPFLLISVLSAPIVRAGDQQRTAAEQRNNDSAFASATSEKNAATVARVEPKSTPNTAEQAQRFYQQGMALIEAGKLAEALVAFKESLRLRPDDLQTNLSLGITQAKTKSYKEAFEAFKRAARVKPDSAEVHFRLGMTSQVLGKRNQANEEHKLLVQLKSPLANRLNDALKNSNLLAVADGITADLSALLDKSVDVSAPVTPKNSEASVAVNNVDPNEKPLTEIYKVGVGDILDIRFLNSTNNRSTLFTVMPGGYIDVPVAGGATAVGGLTLDEIQTRISSELNRRAVQNNGPVSVGVRQYVSHSVMVTGLVSNPGVRFLRRESVPLYVVLAEAQLRNDAGRVSILRRATNQVLELKDPASLNVVVQSGDVITLTARLQEFYYLGGRINYPGQKPFEHGVTLLQAILGAGGTRGNESTVEVSREGTTGRLVTTKFNLKAIKSGIVEDPKLQAGDRIEVIR
jgi:protein involved in polysaccharide export with SLBB domain